MMSIATIGLMLSCFFYLAACFLYTLGFFKTDIQSEKKSFLCIWLGFIFATLYLGLEAGVHGFAVPILNFSHVLAFFSWALAFLYLIPLMGLQTQSFGLILAPVLCLLNFLAMAHAADPAYHMDIHIYFALHIIFAFFAYASLTLSFSAALFYLIQHNELKRRRASSFYHKLPNLETLDHLIYLPILFGIILLAVAVVVGMLWSHDIYGQIWMNDPKAFLTIMSMALYSFLLSLRFASSMRSSRIAMLSILIFLFMISGFVGGRYMKSKHSNLAKPDVASLGGFSEPTPPRGTAPEQADS